MKSAVKIHNAKLKGKKACIRSVCSAAVGSEVMRTGISTVCKNVPNANENALKHKKKLGDLRKPTLNKL